MSIRLVNGLLRVLGNTEQPPLRYVWKVGLIAIVPSICIAMLIGGMVPETRPQAVERGDQLIRGLSALFVAPVVQTLLMWPLIAALARVGKTSGRVALASALLWSVAHAAINSPRSGLVVFWPFFVYSVCFVEWRRKSPMSAVAVTSLVHMFHNLLPSSVMLYNAWR